MNFKKITSTLLVAGLATAAFAADGEFSLKGNVQTQATKMVADDSSNFSSLWVRANVGGQYKSENLDGLIMLRIFAPQVGNKILADLYWANYKWNFENYKLNLKIGHWKTDWSQSTHFGTYIDKALTARGLWMRDYSHDLRFEEDLKFNSLDIPLELKLAYRVNAIDRIQNTAALTHHIATYISYSFSPALRVYGEFANIHTQNDGIKMDKKPRNYVAPESNYLVQDKTYNPFYFGLEFTPKEGLLNTLMSSLYIEWERIGDRQKVHISKDKMDDWAWVFAWAKKVGKSKLQFSLYSGNEISDLGLAFRLTTTFK